MIYNIISDKRTKNDVWKRLTIAKWVFYFCGIAAWVLSFGVIAEVEAMESRNQEQIGVCVCFCVACVTCACIMFFQRMWYIKYNDEVLIFRNSFGLVKKYYIDELTIIDGERVNQICHNGKTVIKWDNMIMNLEEEIEIYQHFKNTKKK